ncbi:MAG: cytochrome b/b6 domain-containing protein [Flavobacteriales bacterium]|nr:cytochrome b/b6 domain-containing protein [Flavobacteriales bacterium]
MENRNYSKVYRVMHWLIALSMLFLLLTVFLRLGWMNKVHIADIIKQYLATTNQTLSDEQLIVLAKQIRKPMWDWHIYIGYVLVGLYVIRLLLPFFGEMKFRNPFNKELPQKVKFQYIVYLLFYLCVALSLITGLVIELGPKEFKEPMEKIHILSIYYLLAFIAIHFAGVLMAEFTNQKGIISKIISGNK